LLPWFGGAAAALAVVFVYFQWLDGGVSNYQPKTSGRLSLTPAPAGAAAPSADAKTRAAPLKIAILQAPGSSSTPGWLLTQSAALELYLQPLVELELAPAEAAYLWTQTASDPAPRRLSRVMPGQALRLAAQQIGPVQAGQIFEMTLEQAGDASPQEPQGPVLFIGRAVSLEAGGPPGR
jgi:anti-sigma-K factor RskA